MLNPHLSGQRFVSAIRTSSLFLSFLSPTLQSQVYTPLLARLGESMLCHTGFEQRAFYFHYTILRTLSPHQKTNKAKRNNSL